MRSPCNCDVAQGRDKQERLVPNITAYGTQEVTLKTWNVERGEVAAQNTKRRWNSSGAEHKEGIEAWHRSVQGVHA